MHVPDLFFMFFTIFVLVTASIVAFSSNMLHSAFTLFFVLFGMAGFYVLLGGDFVAMVQLMVYAGGVNVLLIFGTMLTGDIAKPEISNLSFQGILTFFSGVSFMAVLLTVFEKTEWTLLEKGVREPTTAELGKLLLKDYILPFEVISFLLLAAMVGSVLIVLQREKD
ncbi:MAG: NADH-quinone oxidoreductase subunit J [SAR324 cluster bacterium]|nr:NADH-quinone oxidoreductase subunit J [SAR324 cluster bacterium]